MPKEKISVATRLRNYVSEFGNIFTTDSKILFCTVCNIKIASDKCFSVTQHIATEKHQRGVNHTENKKKTQQLISKDSSSKSSFNNDLCKAMLSANIPLNKLSNTYFKQFLIKYTGQNIPDQTTLRKVNVDHCYQEVLNEIGQKVAGKKIWVSIDQTTDAEGRFIASVIIDTLFLDRPGEIFLFNLEQLQKTNHSTICSLFENSLYLLWPDGIRRNDVLLFLSDAAPYMVKAGDTLKVLYPKIVHVTCTSHGLHRVAEQIRIQFPKVDKLVANVKRVFKKAPHRVQKFHTDAPNISLPPEPILTRWGTFDENDALSIKNAQKYFTILQMKGNLTFIHSNFACLPIAITRLQKQSISLSEGIAIIQDISSKFSQLTGTAGIDINKKLQTVLNKNKGFPIVCNISKILTGEEENVGDLDIPEDLTSSDMAYFKFAPITSADVERSFSLYKNILAPNRSFNMVYQGENMLVIESKAQAVCRFLLNRADLIKLQYLEWSITETVVRKSTLIRPEALSQFQIIGDYIDREFTDVKSPPKNIDEIIIFIKNLCDNSVISNMPKNDVNLISQLKMYASSQLAEQWAQRWNGEMSLDVNP
ncbi:hypothetical protein QTP88_001714 [Uroleucon formosanum]